MEMQILHWFESIHNPVLNYIMYFFTILGDAGIFWIASAIVFIVLYPTKYRKVGVSMAIALVLSVIMCNGVMKNLFARPRCFWDQGQFMVIGNEFENLFGVFDHIDDWSFPSGHTSASFAAAVAVWMWKKREGAIYLIFAVLISVSRLYLTVHYPSDVLVSMVLGSIYGVLGFLAVKKLSFFDKPWFRGEKLAK